MLTLHDGRIETSWVSKTVERDRGWNTYNHLSLSVTGVHIEEVSKLDPTGQTSGAIKIFVSESYADSEGWINGPGDITPGDTLTTERGVVYSVVEVRNISGVIPGYTWRIEGRREA